MVARSLCCWRILFPASCTPVRFMDSKARVHESRFGGSMMVQRGCAMVGSGRVACAPATLLFCALLQVGGAVHENS